MTTGKLLEKLDHCDCLIVPGYQGITLDHEITTLGRGGSDYTAMLLAQALGLEDVSILTDVSGIYEADPKQNPDARHWMGNRLRSDAENDRRRRAGDAASGILFAREHQLRVWVGSSLQVGKGTWIQSCEDSERVIADKPAPVRRLISELAVLGCPCSLNWASSQKGLLPLNFGEGQIRPQPLTRLLLERAELIVILPPSRDGGE